MSTVVFHANWWLRVQPPPPPLVLPSPPPSAGGAGGRYTWGKLGEIYDDDGRPKDSKDPNYDSEEVTTSARSDL